MKYILDANIFIEANKRYYSKEIVPSFWEFLKKDNDIYTIKEVKEEIKAGNDNLFNLIKDVKELKNNNSQQTQKITTYINSEYSKAEVNKFFSGADIHLIFSAVSENNLKIVTHEKLLSEKAKRISIANICKKFRILYCDTFEMLKEKEIDLCTLEKKP